MLVQSKPAAPPLTFDDVYEGNVDFVWRCLRRLGLNGAVVGDAAQDVFLVVHRRLCELGPDASLRGWLFVIVTNIARDYRRRDRRKGGLEDLSGALPDGAPGPAENFERAEHLRLLDSLLAELDEDRREVFILAEIEQMTAPEIAATLSLGINAVYSKLRLARRDFEGALARQKARQR